MPNDSVAELRRRAQLARRLADAIYSQTAKAEMRDLADRFESEAELLEQQQQSSMPPQA